MTLHSKIKFRWTGLGADGKPFTKIYDTTPGRVMLGPAAAEASEDVRSTSATA